MQSVQLGRCLVTVLAHVHIPVKTCGHTLSVCKDPAPLGVLALLDRSGRFTLCLCLCLCTWSDVIGYYLTHDKIGFFQASLCLS